MAGAMNSGDAFDYIIVGSGAGGGTLAARLAEAGRRVLLLEAGGDPRLLSGTNDYQPGIDRLPDDYDVPSFHGFASENDARRWISLSVTMPTRRCMPKPRAR
jgi:choline dehydrogenase